jgi:hypothetical protein
MYSIELAGARVIPGDSVSAMNGVQHDTFGLRAPCAELSVH